MDIVIPYKNSLSNGLELRYTLRGIEMYFPELENVFIIGDCPGFLQNIIHTPAPNAPSREMKAHNIMSKLMLACQDKRVSDSFAMFNDDHFLLQAFTGEYFHCGTLEKSISQYTSHQSYRQTLVNTLGVVNGGNDYDIHCPIVYRKDIFIRSIKTVDWSKSFGYGIKSLYGNLAGIGGSRIDDLKFKWPLPGTIILERLKGRRFFSFDDRALNSAMKTVLHSLYPEKSIYESD